MSGHSPAGGGRAQNDPRGRTVYFAFRYDEDRRRAEIVYAALRARHPHDGFHLIDSSVSAQARALGEEQVKEAIRAGVDQSAVTCVLIGTRTWQDPWVRYEIACSVARGNGLLAVRLTGIADPDTHEQAMPGWSPLAHLGIGKIKRGDYRLFENISGQWNRYPSHPPSLAKPAYLPDMSQGYVQPLSVGLPEYDYAAENGAQKLADWIELAAMKAGKR